MQATPTNPYTGPGLLPVFMKLDLAVPKWIETPEYEHKAKWPITMEVDYVRYFVHAPPPPPQAPPVPPSHPPSPHPPPPPVPEPVMPPTTPPAKPASPYPFAPPLASSMLPTVLPAPLPSLVVRSAGSPVSDSLMAQPEAPHDTKAAPSFHVPFLSGILLVCIGGCICQRSIRRKQPIKWQRVSVMQEHEAEGAYREPHRSSTQYTNVPGRLTAYGYEAAGAYDLSDDDAEHLFSEGESDVGAACDAERIAALSEPALGDDCAALHISESSHLALPITEGDHEMAQGNCGDASRPASVVAWSEGSSFTPPLAETAAHAPCVTTQAPSMDSACYTGDRDSLPLEPHPEPAAAHRVHAFVAWDEPGTSDTTLAAPVALPHPPPTAEDASLGALGDGMSECNSTPMPLPFGSHRMHSRHRTALGQGVHALSGQHTADDPSRARRGRACKVAGRASDEPGVEDKGRAAKLTKQSAADEPRREGSEAKRRARKLAGQRADRPGGDEFEEMGRVRKPVEQRPADVRPSGQDDEQGLVHNPAEQRAVDRRVLEGSRATTVKSSSEPRLAPPQPARGADVAQALKWLSGQSKAATPEGAVRERAPFASMDDLWDTEPIAMTQATTVHQPSRDSTPAESPRVVPPPPSAQVIPARSAMAQPELVMPRSRPGIDNRRHMVVSDLARTMSAQWDADLD